MNIKIHAIYISSGHDFVGRHGKGRLDHGIEKVESVECLAGRGLVNDRFLDHEEDFKGQITFFDWAVYEQIQTQCNLPDLDPKLFRRNVLTSGVDLNTLIGKRFTLQGIEFEGVEECRQQRECSGLCLRQHVAGLSPGDRRCNSTTGSRRDSGGRAHKRFHGHERHHAAARRQVS